MQLAGVGKQLSHSETHTHPKESQSYTYSPGGVMRESIASIFALLAACPASLPAHLVSHIVEAGRGEPLQLFLTVTLLRLLSYDDTNAGQDALYSTLTPSK